MKGLVATFLEYLSSNCDCINHEITNATVAAYMNNNRLFQINQSYQTFLINFFNYLIYLFMISNLIEPFMLVDKNEL